MNTIFTPTSIETFTGKHFDYSTMEPESVCIEDIAHALANLCRFTGHTRRFYSVAEHSLWVAEWLERNGHDDETQLKGLLHDAHEAYVSDMNRPLSRMIPDFGVLKAKIDVVVWAGLGIEPMSPEEAHIIKYSDNVSLATEGYFLMPSRGRGWSMGVDADMENPPVSRTPYESEALFLQKYHDLTNPPVAVEQAAPIQTVDELARLMGMKSDD